ncbi:hypothetical protein OG266_20800 [Streptomyces sp. NBC_00554]|uniref:hypothetical protein n=1 Tax=Streptomyces sp. NBC_00554 TaxID=2903661 RepID=UPI00352CFFC4|nr:hypothetical protein OG266_20800 [Streptomyces sp. NBC_00554]
MNKRLTATMATTGIAALLMVGLPAGVASAAPIICEPGYKHATWTSLSSAWVITHAKQINIPQDGTGKYTKSATYRSTVSSGREITAGASYSAQWVISSMDAHVSGTLTKAGEKTKETSESVEFNFNKSGTYVVFSGVKKASGYWEAKTCNGSGTGYGKKAYGKARSWSVQTEGGVKCTEAPARGTAKKAAKAYC